MPEDILKSLKSVDAEASGTKDDLGARPTSPHSPKGASTFGPALEGQSSASVASSTPSSEKVIRLAPRVGSKADPRSRQLQKIGKSDSELHASGAPAVPAAQSRERSNTAMFFEQAHDSRFDSFENSETAVPAPGTVDEGEGAPAQWAAFDSPAGEGEAAVEPVERCDSSVSSTDSEVDSEARHGSESTDPVAQPLQLQLQLPQVDCSCRQPISTRTSETENTGFVSREDDPSRVRADESETALQGGGPVSEILEAPIVGSDDGKCASEGGHASSSDTEGELM